MSSLFLFDARNPNQPWHDASTRYRCFHVAEGLRLIGQQADVSDIRAAETPLLQRYETVIIQRPRYSPTLRRVVKRCKQLQIRVIADFDDLLFVPELAGLSPAVRSGQISFKLQERNYRKHAQALALFDEVFVSTDPLAAHVRQQLTGSRVDVLPNKLSSYWLHRHTGEQTLASCLKKSDGHQTIAYLSGSRSHNQDFSLVEPVLEQMLKQNCHLKLRIIGRLDFNNQLFDREQLEIIDWLPYESLPALINSAQVTIAPLRDNEFNICKSHVKFIESAAMGTPVVTSPIPDIVQHGSVPGLYLASSACEWETALWQAMDDSDYRQRALSLVNYAKNNCANDRLTDNPALGRLADTCAELNGAIERAPRTAVSV